jgi:hypothetical protein
MRYLLYVTLLCGSLFGQAMIDAAAATAGGAVGGVAGKKVSDGLSGILGKVDQVTAKAAKGKATEKDVPLFEVGPPVPKGSVESVPPPPPLGNHATARPVFAQVQDPRTLPFHEIRPPSPAPPELSVQDLKAIPIGMSRAEVLNMGAPAARITMFEGGHLLEVYRYATNDTPIGVIELSDGTVSSVR